MESTNTPKIIGATPINMDLKISDLLTCTLPILRFPFSIFGESSMLCALTSSTSAIKKCANSWIITPGKNIINTGMDARFSPLKIL